RHDPANFRCRDEHILGPGLLVELLDGIAVQQLQVLPGSSDQLSKTLPLELTPDGAARQTAMASDENARVPLHGMDLRRAVPDGQVLIPKMRLKVNRIPFDEPSGPPPSFGLRQSSSALDGFVDAKAAEDCRTPKR